MFRFLRKTILRGEQNYIVSNPVLIQVITVTVKSEFKAYKMLIIIHQQMHKDNFSQITLLKDFPNPLIK
jgi:hypothetical protein